MNDNLRQDVNAEADRRWPHTGNGGDLDHSRAVRRLTFRQGAEWAALHVQQSIEAERLDTEDGIGFEAYVNGLMRAEEIAREGRA